MNRMKHIIIAFVLLVLVMLSSGCGLIFHANESKIAKNIFQIVNEHRLSIGLNALEWNETIASECWSHSREMASGSVPVGHDGFEQRAANIRDTISYTAISENVASYNIGLLGLSSPAANIVDSWLGSAGHRLNIEGDFNLTGVGVVKNGSTFYVTQIFVKAQ